MSSDITSMGSIFTTIAAGKSGGREIRYDFYVEYEDGGVDTGRWIDVNENGRADAGDRFGIGSDANLPLFARGNKSCGGKVIDPIYVRALAMREYRPFEMHRMTEEDVYSYGFFLDEVAPRWSRRLNEVRQEAKRIGQKDCKMSCEKGDAPGSGRMKLKTRPGFWAKEAGASEPFSYVVRNPGEEDVRIVGEVKRSAPDYAMLMGAFQACLKVIARSK